VEYLLGSVESYARAALRLSLLGFYDESLTLVRSIGEKANLFMLFIYDAEAFRQWITSSEQQKRQKFSAVKVRIALESSGQKPPIDKVRYGVLSGRGIHPGGSPQDFNELHRPELGGVFQKAGLAVTLNEIGRSLAYAYGLGILLLDHLSTESRIELQQAAVELANELGRLDATSIEELWQEIGKARAVASGSAPS
jgi:hypothetical protein